MLLADLGADVVKIEPPAGDPMREWPPIVLGPGGRPFSFNFASINRNKRSVVADLKSQDDRKTVRRLCGECDVIVENYRAGVMSRLGFGFEDVAADHRGLVYCSITGYGQTGPYAQRGAFDVAVQGMSGLMSVTGEEDGPPVKCGVPVGDFVAGLYSSFTILAARDQVASTGQSVHLDCSMLNCLLGISALQTSEYWGTGVPARRLGSAHPRNAPYQAFMASDKPFILAAGSDKLWWEVCQAVGMLELRDDARFVNQFARAAHAKELAGVLQPVFSARPADEWLVEFDRRGVPSAPVYNYAEVLDDRHVRLSGLIRDFHLPNGVDTSTVAFPVGMTGYDFELFRPAPESGEHTEEVVAEWLGEAQA